MDQIPIESRHKKTMSCLVQFQDTADDEMPRMYLASPAEIAEVMNATAKGRGDTILYKWGPHADGSGTIDQIPEEWKFTGERAQYMLETYGQSKGRQQPMSNLSGVIISWRNELRKQVKVTEDGEAWARSMSLSVL